MHKTGVKTFIDSQNCIDQMQELSV